MRSATITAAATMNESISHQSMKSFFCVSTFTRSSSSLDTDKARLRRLSVLMRKIEKVEIFSSSFSLSLLKGIRQGSRRANEKCHGERRKREQKLISRSLATHSLTDCVVITLLLPPFPTLWWIIRILILFIHFPLTPSLLPSRQLSSSLLEFSSRFAFLITTRLTQPDTTLLAIISSSCAYQQFSFIFSLFHTMRIVTTIPTHAKDSRGFLVEIKKNSSCW